jgi:transposase
MGATERDEWLRAAWRVTLAGAVDPRRLVFVDEMGTNTSLSPRYAYSPKGRRAYAQVPRNRGANTTLLASMSLEGMGPCLAVEGATTARVFEAYVEQVLAPRPWGVDRSSWWTISALTREGGRARELIEERGCELLYLPPYSPDFNPIEEAFSKIKGALRKAQARTRQALIEALGAAISTVTARDARGFFEHSGYYLPVHLLWNTL